MKYEVIDNFLDEEYFDSLVTLFTDKEKTGNQDMPWYFQSDISDKNIVQDKLFYMTHMFYENNMPKSNFYDNMTPLEKYDTDKYIGEEIKLFSGVVGFSKSDSLANGVEVPYKYIVEINND